MRLPTSCRLAGSAIAATLMMGAQVSAEPLAMSDLLPFPGSIFQQIMPDPATRYQQGYQQPDVNVTEKEPVTTPERFRRQIVAYDGREQPGTIIIDTP